MRGKRNGGAVGRALEGGGGGGFGGGGGGGSFGGGGGGGCATLVDTSTYLHARWAPERIASSLASRKDALRFVVVLSDPVDRAVRHWRTIVAALARAPGGPRSGGERGAPTARAYTNGTTLAKKVRAEASQMEACIAGGQGSAGGGNGGGAATGGGALAVRKWQECTTRACNWFECIVGAGLYAPQLRHWLQHFPRERFFLLEESQLSSQPETVASALSRFLALPRPLTPAQVLGAFPNHTTPVVGDAVRKALRSFYSPHLRDVRQLFGELAFEGSRWADANWLHEDKVDA